MKILLTGAGGFLGQVLYNNLRSRGHRVLPVVRRSLGLPDEIVFDFTKDEIGIMAEVISSCDAIIHLAALIDFNADFNAELFEVNFVSTVKLSRLAADYKIHFIFTSTVSISKPIRGVINQDSADFPDNHYSLSKYLAEKVIENLGKNYCIIRVGGIYGNSGPEHLYLNKAISQAVDNGISPTLVGSGQSKRNYIYVHDLANWIVNIAEKRQVGKLLISGPEVLDIRTILTQLSQVFLQSKEISVIAKTESSADVIIDGRDTPPFKLKTYQEAFLDIKKLAPKS